MCIMHVDVSVIITNKYWMCFIIRVEYGTVREANKLMSDASGHVSYIHMIHTHIHETYTHTWYIHTHETYKYMRHTYKHDKYLNHSLVELSPPFSLRNRFSYTCYIPQLQEFSSRAEKTLNWIVLRWKCWSGFYRAKVGLFSLLQMSSHGKSRLKFPGQFLMLLTWFYKHII